MATQISSVPQATYQHVKTWVGDGVGWISLNRPPWNIITIAMSEEIEAAIHAYNDDSAVRIIVLTSEGERAFASGASVEEHKPGAMHDLAKAMYGTIEAFMAPASKPSICAIKGWSSGGGNEIAFACDVVVARADAVFSQPEIESVGAAGTLGAALWAYDIPQSKAMELALTGDRIDAAEALRLGMITRVLPVEGYEQALADYLALYTRNSGSGIRNGRKHLRMLWDTGRIEKLALLERLQMIEGTQTEDCAEGIDAFLGKRKPVWTHR